MGNEWLDAYVVFFFGVGGELGAGPPSLYALDPCIERFGFMKKIYFLIITIGDFFFKSFCAS